MSEEKLLFICRLTLFVLQLAGRILLVFMFLTLLRFEMSAMQVSQILISTDGVHSSVFADHSELGWLHSDGSGHDRLQDQAVRPGARHLAQHSQLLLQRLVDHSCIQTYERFPQIRLLPGNISDALVCELKGCVWLASDLHLPVDEWLVASFADFLL